MNIETIQASNPTSRAALWRSQAGHGNPAGELFAADFAEADIVGGTDIIVTNCVLCTGSVDANTRHVQCGA